ncbi:MAG: wax ester/triacylglycerol synthase domain-containing protein [Actinomycetota bacterium]
MHQLSPSESELLAAESVTNLGHQSLVLELDDNRDGERITLDRLRAAIESSLHLVVGLRRRVVEVPLGLDDPWWIEDPHFDLDYHIRHLAVPGSSDPHALEQLLARLHERPLDRNRPLWELYLIENPDGPTNIFVKVHIVLIEELGPLGPLAPVLAGTPTDLDQARPARWQPDMVPTDSELLVKAAWSLGRSPTRAARHVLGGISRVPLLGEVSRLVLASARSRSHPIELARNDRAVPRVSFNRTVSAHRRVARVTLPLDRLRDIHRMREVRFHDVLLTVISGALRHWMVLNDELPSEPLVALTPLLVDSDGDDELGAALVPLATHRHDALQRLADVSDAMSQLTMDIDPKSATDIARRAEPPSALAGTAARLLVTTGAGLRLLPPFNVYVVNIPGRDEGPIAGHPIVREHAMVPIVDGIGLSISAISHDDRVDLTLVADRDLVPDLRMLADRFEIELEELHRVSRSRQRRSGRRKRAS